MNLREASDRLIALYVRRWLFAIAAGIPGLLIAGELQETHNDRTWLFIRNVYAGFIVAILAIGLAWVASGLFERGAK